MDATQTARVEELKENAMERIEALQAALNSARDALTRGKYHRLSETGHLASAALRADLVIAQLVEVERIGR
jgi:hypothetical protein